MKPVTEATRRNLPAIIDAMQTPGYDLPLTESEWADYWQRLSGYATTGRQSGLPFTNDKDAANGC